MTADGKSKQPLNDLVGRFPKYSPDGTKIALYHWYDNPRELWISLYTPETNSLKKLAYVTKQGISTIVWFSWSYDGTRIVYGRPTGEPGRADIWTVDTSGMVHRRLTDSGWNVGGVWSPDGGTIYYDVWYRTGIVGYLMNADGSNKRPVPYRPPGLGGWSLSWSPKGDLIAFTGKVDSTWMFTPQTDIFVTDPAGTNVRRITFDEASGKARWSPDGKKIAFQSGGELSNNVFVMDPDGSNRRQLTTHGKALPSEMLWSPDGEKILYVYEVAPREDRRLHVINADGSNDIDTGIKGTIDFDWKPMRWMKK
jgi:Tol biopolymer transport system component